MDPKNFDNLLSRFKYILLKPLNKLNFKSNTDKELARNLPFLKILQYKTFLNLCIKKNCLKIIEFGSGRSTIFFLENYKSYDLFYSIDTKKEEKYTDLVREEINKKNLNNKKFKILNIEVEQTNIDEENTLKYKYNLETSFDLMYIDGPGLINYDVYLIHNILLREIKSKIYFFDGRHKFIDKFIKILRKNNIKFHIKHSHLLNYTIIEIDNS